ncbi:unnamed protein product [Fusarium venenatum]|uniref:Uncharacterized protein n=1 Tax=Fusarium venenatum TaxID=56646 RepID=A0A2L2SRC2_9HYPO|nr:uncharacterized protein FVRRES_12162 [Fusarium venenatum]CEI39471.1 unnamed protein product [Fusarium venenatum]
MGSVTLTTEYGRDTQDAALASFMPLASSFTARNSLYVSDVTQFGINPDIPAELSSWTKQRRKDVNIATARLLYIYNFPRQVRDTWVQLAIKLWKAIISMPSQATTSQSS